MEEKVSVIVPIYNIDKYLERGIESIVKQTYKNLEILLIDDGSTDKCPEICEKWGGRDNRIKIIHKENGGLCNARNTGLKNATGKYIYFFDPDDYCELELIDTMVKSMSDKYDMSICNYYIEKNKVIPKMKMSDNILDKKNLYNMVLQKQFFCGYVWNKLYSNSIIKKNNIRFNENVTMLEDMLFFCEYVKNINNDAIYISKPLYHYCIRENSIINNKIFNDNKLEVFNALDILMEIYDNGSKEDLIFLKERYIKTTYTYIYQLKRNDRNTKILLNQIKKSKELKKEIIKKLNFKKKIEIIFITRFPIIYGNLREKIRKE